MTFDPDVSFFITFQELDPRAQRQCIFYTLQGKRCSWDCREVDNGRAIKLYDQINLTPDTELPSLEVLEDYAKYNCCGPKPKGARHQNRIEDLDLLTPLAERWLDEIRQRRSAGRVIAQSSTPATGDGHTITSPGLTVAPFVSHLTTTYPPDIPTIIEAQQSITTAAEFVTGLPSKMQSSEEYSKFNEHESHLEGTGPRYDLRRRNDFGDKNKGSSNRRPRTPLSIFRPHVEEPDENVLSKLLSPLVKDDFKRGSLYIFTRVSSPGYVKIGWTSREVEGRLESWSRCGYEPNLVSSVHDIPYAQRAETLTHYELVAEWRAERRCKGCGKSHREWFEVSQVRATHVVADWAEFMKSATIYDASGRIKENWRNAIEKMSKTNAPVTANKLLRHYKASILARAMLEEPVEEGNALEAGVPQSETPANSERDQSKLSQSPREMQVGTGFNFSFKTPPATKPTLNFLTPPQTPSPQRMADNSAKSSSNSRTGFILFERQGQKAFSATMGKIQPQAKFDFSLDNSVEKHSASITDDKGIFSFQAPIDNRLASRAETRFDFCLKTPPEKPSDLKKDQTSDPLFDFLVRPQYQQHPHITTVGMPDLDFKLPAKNQLDLGSGNKFRFSFDPPFAKEPALTEFGKFDFSFKPPMAHPSLTITEKDEPSSKAPHEDQTFLPTNEKVDLSSKLVAGKQCTFRTRPILPITPPRSVDVKSSAKPPRFELPPEARIFPLAEELITPPKFPNRENVSEEEQKRQNVSS